jgi:ATP-dependent Lon protease
VKEKAVAALRGGVRTVILPSGNVHDLELLPDEVREGLAFVPVDDMDRVMEEALVGAPFQAGSAPAPAELAPARRSHG